MQGKKREVLILDSGCSGHMTGNKSLLSEFEEKAGPAVSYGDGNLGQTLGYGNIEIGNVIIEKVALVSGLKHNLLSISQITDRGYHVNFMKDHCEIINKKTQKIILTGYRHGNIYEANLSSITDGRITCLLSKASASESWIWHKKLSHLNFSNLNELVRKDLVRGLPKVMFNADGLCDACQKAKQRRTSFKNKTESSIDEPLHLLHLDLFGPVNVLSISKKRYALVIVDEFTRFTWVYFLFRKDETPEIILEHVKLMENNSVHKVKILRSDNGTEFKNTQMNDFCKQKGISHQFSAPGTPQQNGVVERKNRTLIEAGRTMLEEANLPTYFWEEAISTACFTQNCTLINRHGVTPYQSLKGKKPSLKHLHIFGCKCFVLRTHPEQLGKFEAKADEGIFVGYPLTTRAYRVFNLRTRYIVESINVSFDDGKITGFDDDNHANLEFENDQITADDSSEPEKSNTDEINTDDDVNAHFQGEHVQNDISDLLSSSTEDSDETENTDESSNSDGTSNADEGLQSAESTENNAENTISGGASEETQENSLEDLTDELQRGSIKFKATVTTS